jgi:hypothetical protein
MDFEGSSKKWNLEKSKARKLIVDELRDAGPVIFFLGLGFRV